MKLITIIGARPQFIKASAVSKAIAEQGTTSEVIVHTGQHFDSNMSDIFFGQLGLPKPDYQLDINDCSHGEMTGRMLCEIERIVMSEKPQMVMVYGDTNSTLAGALAAAKLNVPVAHVEAGLRSFNMRMPEEINRILTDQVSSLLFCPTETAVKHLHAEGLDRRDCEILQVGDVMQDTALYFAQFSEQPKGVQLPKRFMLATLHRAENTDDVDRMQQIAGALEEIHQSRLPVVLPLHPRTRATLTRLCFELDVQMIDPVGYLEMIWLLQHCELVLTDSGGVQKESYFFGKPCVTMRDETEWTELVACGANTLAGADRKKIVSAVSESLGNSIDDSENLYGGGTASLRIAKRLARGISTG